MKAFWEQHWDKIITIILSSAFTAVVTFFITIMSVNDKIERAKDLYHNQVLEITEKFNNQICALTEKFDKEIEAVRSEYNKDKSATSSHISKIEKEVSKVEECVYGYLKPYAADIGPLKTKFEKLKSDVDYLREKYSSDTKIADSLANINLNLERFMQADDFKQWKTRAPNTVKKATAVDGT